MTDPMKAKLSHLENDTLVDAATEPAARLRRLRR